MPVPSAPLPAVQCRDLGLRDYSACWQEMAAFTEARDDASADELWFVQHPPVFTLGKNGKPEHILDAGDIPVVHSDRGGQVTYHGPGQLVVYTLLDLRRRNLGVRAAVSLLEQSVIDTLAQFGIASKARPEAPGVYVNDAKIAALGLRVRKGCCFHGLSLNIDVDLAPFSRINPCGYQGLAVTRLADLRADIDFARAQQSLQAQLLELLSDER